MCLYLSTKWQIFRTKKFWGNWKFCADWEMAQYLFALWMLEIIQSNDFKNGEKKKTNMKPTSIENNRFVVIKLSIDAHKHTYHNSQKHSNRRFGPIS